MVIFDTNSFTDFYYNQPAIRARAEKYVADHPDEQFAVASITWFELISGRYSFILTAENEAKIKEAQKMLEATTEALSGWLVVPVNDDAAKHFERLRTKKKPKFKRRADLLIACIALAHKALLVTRNVKDFKDVPDLRHEDWMK